MRAVWMTAAAVAALAGVVGSASITTAADSVVAERVGDFQLTDTNRLAHRLYYYDYAPAIVLMSQTNGTPLSRAAASELAKLQAAYKDKGVLFYMVNSNTGDSREETATEVAANNFAVPVLMDDLQLVGEALNIQREGEVFVINPKDGFKLVYHGPLDDRFNSARPNLNAKVKNAYTTQAIDAVLARRPVATPNVAVRGGRIIAAYGKRADHANISYANTIAPIIQNKCVSCHQKGGIGPFEMTSYDVIKGYAPMIRETLMTKRMPPWFADPHVGSWSNDMGLTAEQTKTLVHWIDAGAPRGAGEDILKTQASEAPEWPTSLGKPDVVVTLPAFSVPANGVIEYQRMVVDNPFKEDQWLRAVVFKPGARPVLHHITSSYSADRTRPPASIPGSTVGSFVPGAGTQVYNDGTGAPVPGGGKFSYSMHYTTVGRAMTDRTQIGYYVTKTPPEIIRRAVVVSDPGLRIPAGAGRHKEVAYLEFPADALLYSVHPHAHYRGYAVELTQITADGKETPILSVPKYDFNWQLDYDLAQPLPIKAGTKLRVSWIYDNSEHNKANPDHKIPISWGEQTFEEMMYFRLNYRWMDETSTRVRNDLQAKLSESRTIGQLDDNADGKIQLSELAPNNSLRARFSALDTNKDGGLTLAEMNAGNATAAAARRLAESDNDL